MKTLELTIRDANASHPLLFPVQRVVNAGFSGRDQKAIQAHIDEMVREGIPAPRAVPILFPFLTANLTTADQIEVIGGSTSGEVEYVLLLTQGQVFVGVGSDHTDRHLERDSIIKSKQICANVISREVWRYQDVLAGWDDMVLQSWVRPTAAEPEVRYQEGRLSSMLPADALIDLVRSRVRDKKDDGMVIYSGTIPLCTGHPIYGETFRAELFDPRMKRRLSCAYRVERLTYVAGTDE